MGAHILRIVSLPNHTLAVSHIKKFLIERQVHIETPRGTFEIGSFGFYYGATIRYQKPPFRALFEESIDRILASEEREPSWVRGSISWCRISATLGILCMPHLRPGNLIDKITHTHAVTFSRGIQISRRSRFPGLIPEKK